MRPRTVGLVHGVVAGEPEPEVVLGQEHVRGRSPDVGLVVADPHELGRGEPGQGVVAGDLDQALGSDRRPDGVAFGGGPLVVPQDRRPEDLVRRIQQDEAVHLAGEPDRDDLGRRDAGRRQDRSDRVDAARPPQPGVLLAPQRPWDVEAVFRDPDPADGPRLVDEDGLRRGGRDVDPEDEAHPGQRLEPDLDSGAVGRPDRLVDHVLEQLLPAGHRPRVDLAGDDPALERGQGRVVEHDRRPEAVLPAGIALLAQPVERLALHEVRRDEERPRERVHPADVGVEQVGPVHALAAELRVEVEAAGVNPPPRRIS